MGANDRQVGGDHYKKHEYGHWDWVCDIGLHYLLGCATKYVSRWRSKNGVEDLEKAIHYVEKAKERGLRPLYDSIYCEERTQRFCAQLDPDDSVAVRYIVAGEWDAAVEQVRWLIDRQKDTT